MEVKKESKSKSRSKVKSKAVDDTTVGGIIPPAESTTSVEDDSDIDLSEESIKIELFDTFIQETIDSTLPEIFRCNEYIFAHADVDRRFSVYREELYTYRYNLRQLKLDNRYPNIPKSAMPEPPTPIADC